MSFIRSDQQVALNNLLVAVRESIDHYHDAAGLLDEKDIRTALEKISHERKAFAVQLEQAIRDSGDLPTVPDPDKEAGAMLIHHVAALLTPQYAVNILEQRIDAEKNLANLIVDGKTAGLDDSYCALLNALAEHVARTIETLQNHHKTLVAAA